MAIKLPMQDVYHALSHYRLGGYEGGHFTRSLLETAGFADAENFARLEMAFPQAIGALRLVRDEWRGEMDDLIARAPLFGFELPEEGK